MTDVRIRVMDRADVGAVAELEAAVSPEPWSAGLFEGEFSVEPESRHWLVAERTVEDQTRLVGFAGMMFVGRDLDGEGHLMNVAVDAGHRRLGIADALCKGLFDEAADRGFDALTLEVRISNRGAIELYRTHGFAPVGIRTGYYSCPDGSKEDGLIMWLHDNISRAAERRQGSEA